MRFAGKVGFGISTEVRPGVFKDVIIEKQYYGDVKRAMPQAETSDKVNDDSDVTNQIEIVADAFASENVFAIRYVWWGGKKWKVPSREVRPPRIILRQGGVYNGPTPNVP